MDRSRRPEDRPLMRRDAEGRASTAPDWDTLTERLIREAQAAGAFDDLPGQGQPLELAEDAYAGDMAMAHHLLRNAGAAPPWIETDKQARELEARIEALIESAGRGAPTALPRLERKLTELADAHDQAVTDLEVSAPSPRQHRRRLRRAELLGRLRSANGGARTRP